MRHHVANVVQAGSIPVSCSELVGLLGALAFELDHDAQHRVHGDLQNRTGSDHPRRASLMLPPTDGAAPSKRVRSGSIPDGSANVAFF